MIQPKSVQHSSLGGKKKQTKNWENNTEIEEDILMYISYTYLIFRV